MANDLEQKIITQVEYYFGDINLPRDKFLKEEIGKTEDGWVPLDVLLTFRRLADLSKDKALIVDALGKSETKLVEISDDKEKLRRSREKPLPEWNDEERNAALFPRSAYAKGFPKDETFDNIMEYLRTHGPIDSIKMRHYRDKATSSHKFKGSVNIIFKNDEDCKKFLEAEAVKYKDTELQRMTQEAFIAEKKAEFDERKNKKQKKGEQEAAAEKCEYPAKTIVKLTSPAVAEKLKWDEIKAKVKELTEMEIAHVNFKAGQTDGHMRFATENHAQQFMEKLGDKKLLVGDFEMTAELPTEEEEKEYYVEWNRERASRKKQHGHGKKRKGNFHKDHKDSPKAKKQQQG